VGADFFGRAAHVDVADVGAQLLYDAGRFRHLLRILAVDLNGDGALIWIESGGFQCFSTVPLQSARRNELCTGQPRSADAAHQAAKGQIGDALHGRQHDWRGDPNVSDTGQGFGHGTGRALVRQSSSIPQFKGSPGVHMYIALLALGCMGPKTPPPGSTEIEVSGLPSEVQATIPMPAPPDNLPMPYGVALPVGAVPENDCQAAFQAAETFLVEAEAGSHRGLSAVAVEVAQRTSQLAVCEAFGSLRIPARVRAGDLNRWMAAWSLEQLPSLSEAQRPIVRETLVVYTDSARSAYFYVLAEAPEGSPWASHARWALVELKAAQ